MATLHSLGRITLSLVSLITPLAFMACSGSSQSVSVDPSPTPYLGATQPGTTPQLFMPDQLKKLAPKAINFDFAPDGKLILISVPTDQKGISKIQMSRFENNTWTALVDAPFIPGFSFTNEPVFSPDGQTLYFTAAKAGGSKDLYTVSFTNGTWGTPVALPAPINSAADEWRGSVAPDGSLYFGSTRLAPSAQLNQVFKATKDASGKWSVTWVPAPINGENFEGDPCVAPDGRWMVFYSCRNWKTADLFVTFKESHGGWGDPINLGPEINASEQQYAPHLSRDGKFLFFTRESAADGVQTFWVSVNAVDKLKPTTAPYFNQPLPGETPVAFAPQQLKNLGSQVTSAAFSPDWTQCFASVSTADHTGSKLQLARFQNGAWTPFQETPFGTDFQYTNEPVFAADGTALTFTGTKANGTKDLWTVPFANQSWGTPVALPAPLNSPGKEHRSTTRPNGTVYFASDRTGVNQIYSAKKDASGAWATAALAAPINSGKGESDPTIPPTGHCMVFTSNRDGQPHLYVSFLKSTGWGTPIKLGPEFNTPDGQEYGAQYSANGNYIFFTRQNSQGTQIFWATAIAVDRYYQ